ncbi:MAG TPA: hypothetical protein VM681_03525 [Candidatus Thermoplasmatota archaeon]|nr:hypothetical protein [Candidatus Thermoplasmatota archaeon]
MRKLLGVLAVSALVFVPSGGLASEVIVYNFDIALTIAPIQVSLQGQNFWNATIQGVTGQDSAGRAVGAGSCATQPGESNSGLACIPAGNITSTFRHQVFRNGKWVTETLSTNRVRCNITSIWGENGVSWPGGSDNAAVYLAQDMDDDLAINVTSLENGDVAVGKIFMNHPRGHKVHEQDARIDTNRQLVVIASHPNTTVDPLVSPHLRMHVQCWMSQAQPGDE